jgi:hypothetical protein
MQGNHMRLVGYCTECHKIKYVRVSAHQLVMAQAKKSNIVEGICDACERR